MKSYILIITILFIIASCGSVKNDSARDKTAILGKISKQTWFDSTHTIDIYNDFQPEKSEISKLQNIVRNSDYRFIIFAGADCMECHEYLPSLFKIFDVAEISENRYDIYVLNNKLEEPGGFHKNYDIPTTPTVFIMKNEKQIGMITYPNFDWLDEILQIIEKESHED